MKKRELDEEGWETPSLEWIHRVRRQQYAKRAGRPFLPLSRKEAEKLTQQYGLKLARPTTADR